MPRVEAKHVSYCRRWCVFPSVVVLGVVVLGLVVAGIVHAIEGGREVLFKLVTQSEQDKCCILLVRLQQRNGQFLWVHAVLQVKDAADTPRQFIVATNQILSEEEASIMLANSWLYQYYGYQNQPCGMLDPRCQKFFRRDQCYQDPYQEPYPYIENSEVDYTGYHISAYVAHKPEDYGCERIYTDRGPVDYSTHSPQSTISEERSPHHYEAPPEVIVNSNMYMYPYQGKREYYEQYQRVNYTTPELCPTGTTESMDYPAAKRMRLAPASMESTDTMERWNPSPPWSDTTLKLADYGQRFTYNMLPMPPERAMVT